MPASMLWGANVQTYHSLWILAENLHPRTSTIACVCVQAPLQAAVASVQQTAPAVASTCICQAALWVQNVTLQTMRNAPLSSCVYNIYVTVKNGPGQPMCVCARGTLDSFDAFTGKGTLEPP
eukprot:577652-Pelagomonas_calceolata.AAC.1